jgi:hypothetical protein
MKKIALCCSLLVAGCDRDRPPAPTAAQHERLDEAEDMLNDMAANEEGAAPEDTAPPNNRQEAERTS